MTAAGIYTTERRYYPGDTPAPCDSLELASARNQTVSCQVVLTSSGGTKSETCRLDAAENPPDGISVRIRRAGFVPVLNYNTDTPEPELEAGAGRPGFVADPLYEENEAELGPFGIAVFWLTLCVSQDAASGSAELVFTVESGGEKSELRLRLKVSQLVLRKREGLSVTHWFYADALLDWYGLEPFEERYWDITGRYMKNLMDHGNDVLYVPLFAPVTDGDRRPVQLLDVGEDGGFNWDSVSRYLSLARKHGFTKFEWPHLFSQWGAKDAVQVYRGQGHSEIPLWEKGLPGTSDRYRAFLADFLPAFKSFLEKEQVFDTSFFHVSDEPHGEEHRANYAASRAMLKDLAPWMKTMDAVSEIEYGRDGLTDIPIPQLGSAADYIKEGISCFTYYCCHPRGEYINRLMDTPLDKIRMLGWALYRHRNLIGGFLQWGYNYWYRSQTRELVDPFTVSDGGAWPNWAYGDTFVVYPGDEGPIDSIRWEAFAEGLQDYTLLQSAGIDPEDALLSPVKDFSEFPRETGWRLSTLRKVIEGE